MMPADAQRKEAEARVGQLLHAKWRLDQLLGVGGMASVYAATHRNGKRGAVKLLHPELSRIEEAKTRFLREGYVANSVGHPGAVSVLDDDVTADGLVFLVMELLEGTTLDQLAEARDPHRLELATVLEMADGLLDVLVAAHEKGIVHRDIKPENLFVTTDGRIHVLDFGIARLRESTPKATTTQAGASMGTPAFMPPEQAMGEWNKVDARTDLWAVGATMYTLLTGRFVHEADTVQKMMLAAMTRPAPPLGALAPELPPAVLLLVDRALATRQEDRYQSALSMQSAVRACRRLVGQPAAPALGPTAPVGSVRTLDSRRLDSIETGLKTSLSTPGLEIVSSTPAVRVTAAPVSSDPGQAPVRRPRLVYLAIPALLALIAIAVIVRFAITYRDRTIAAPPASIEATSLATTASAAATMESVVTPVLPRSASPVDSSPVAEISSVIASSIPSATSATTASASVKAVLKSARPVVSTSSEPLPPVTSPPVAAPSPTPTPTPLFTSRKQ